MVQALVFPMCDCRTVLPLIFGRVRLSERSLGGHRAVLQILDEDLATGGRGIPNIPKYKVSPSPVEGRRVALLSGTTLLLIP